MELGIRKLFLKIIVACLTFMMGLAVFYFFYFKITPNSSQIKENINSEDFKIKEENLAEKFDPWKLPDNFPPLKKGEFFNVGHGCGNGYIDGWLGYDNSYLSEGFTLISPNDFQNEIAQAKTIIERKENYPNKDGKKGLRVVLMRENEETGKEYVSILWFGKWDGKHYGRYFLNGPNWEIALELEKWIIKENSKNK